jgi:hypothetical protein
MKRHNKTFLALMSIALILGLFQNFSDEVTFDSLGSDGKVVALTQSDDSEDIGIFLPIEDLPEQDSPLNRALVNTSNSPTHVYNDNQELSLTRDLVNASNNPTQVYDDNEELGLTRDLVNASNNPTQVYDDNEELGLTRDLVNASNNPTLDSMDLNYICVLEGPGQSVRAVFDSEALAQVRSAPKTICTNAEGCRVIAMLTKVKGIGERGYCKNSSAQSVKMTPDQIANLFGVSL